MYRVGKQMLKGLIVPLAFALATIPGSALAVDNRPLPHANGLIFGAYDPHGDFVNDPNSRIEHLFLPWEDVDLASLASADTYAIERGRTLLVTIEPWTWSNDRFVTPAELRSGIATGRYDGNIAAICSILGDFQTPTTIRWGHEMEDTTGRFIWADWEPADYIAAYRDFVAKCRQYAPEAAFMWSPKGEPRLAEYYPGDDVVDVIGLSVFGLQPYDQIVMQRDMTFRELVAPGYTAAAQFGLPIYVAELGYRGNVAYVEQWLTTVLEKIDEFPLLVGAIYFNDRDVVAWPYNLGVPDWRVTSNVIDDPR